MTTLSPKKCSAVHTQLVKHLKELHRMLSLLKNLTEKQSPQSEKKKKNSKGKRNLKVAAFHMRENPLTIRTWA